MLEVFSSAAILAITGPGAADGVRALGDGVLALGDVRRDATVFAAGFGLSGLATCLGASTVMLGSAVAELVAVCDMAVPLGPHNNAVDRIATAEGATRLLMTCLPNPDGNAAPDKCMVPYIPNCATEG